MTVTAMADGALGNDAGLMQSTVSEHGRDKDVEGIAKCTTSQAALNTFFYMFAAFQIPYAISQAGWFWGIAIIVTCSVISTHSGLVLSDLCVRHKQYTWKDLASASAGVYGSRFVEGLQFFAIFFTSMIQTQGGAAPWQQAFPAAPICQWQWILINAIPYFIFLQVPSFSGSNAMKIATAITLFGCGTRVLVYMGAFMIWGGYPYKCYHGQTMTTIFNGAANLFGSFGVKVIVPEMIREMKNPADYKKAWMISQGLVVPLYIVVGVVGFALYGTFANSTIFNNFKENGVMQFYFLSNAVCGYMPLVYGQIALFLKFELYLGVLPTDWFKISNPETNRCPMVSPVVFRFVFRGGMLLIWLFLAEMLIGLPGPIMFSFFSAISSGAFSFYLPYVFAWMAFGHEFSGIKKAIFILFITVSVALSGLGAFSAAREMTGFDAPLFDFSGTCSGGAGFFMGTWSGNGDTHDWGGYSAAKGNGTFHDTFYLATCGHNGHGGNIDCQLPCDQTCCWTDQKIKSEVSCGHQCALDNPI